MKKLYEVIVTDKLTGEVINSRKDVAEVLKTENLISGEVVIRVTTGDNRTFAYDNSEYDVTIYGKKAKMTREEMLKYAKEHPYAKISHFLFSDDEYIYANDSGIFLDENGYVFENWEDNQYADGLRTREDGDWLNGWYIK